MASKFLTNIDLNQNELINAKFQVVGTLPSVGNTFEGHLVYNSATNTIHVYANGAWRSLPHTIVSGGGAGIAEALEVSESNGTITLTLKVADTDSAGLLSADFWNALTDATSDATASKLVKRDANGNIKVATPTDDAHAATKGYVDAARAGLDVKASVRAATTNEMMLIGSYAVGEVTVDGVQVVAGDRILVKNQAGNPQNNGIYIVVDDGPWTRATDADSSAEVTAGMFTFVAEGTVNADSGWVLTTNDTITLGTTALTFAQFSGAGSITAGNGLTKTGNTIDAVGTADRITVNSDSIDIASTYAGQNTITTLGTITTGTWNGTDVAIADGGTGSGTASGARTNLAETSASGLTTSTPVLARIAKQGCAASAAGVSTTTVTHNFGTTDVMVQIYEVASGATVFGDVSRSNGNTISVVLNGTISANDYTIVVTG
jgi:hypothetical protein